MRDRSAATGRCLLWNLGRAVTAKGEYYSWFCYNSLRLDTDRYLNEKIKENNGQARHGGFLNRLLSVGLERAVCRVLSRALGASADASPPPSSPVYTR